MSARTYTIAAAAILAAGVATVRVRGGLRTIGRATTVRTVRPGAR